MGLFNSASKYAEEFGPIKWWPIKGPFNVGVSSFGLKYMEELIKWGPLYKYDLEMTLS